MQTYLLNWNPRRTVWTELSDEVARSRQGLVVHRRWSTGGTKRINPGDRVFLIKQVVEPKGIIASGIVTTLYSVRRTGAIEANKRTT